MMVTADYADGRRCEKQSADICGICGSKARPLGRRTMATADDADGRRCEQQSADICGICGSILRERFAPDRYRPIILVGMPDESPYETDALLSQYLMFHYGDVMAASPRVAPPPDSMDFHARCAALAIEFTAPELRRRAIDIGCAVGRATFELCRACGEVIGIDYSKKFIAACGALKREGRMSYRYPVEGEIMAEATARVPHDIAREKAHFDVGDACALNGDLGVFGVVLMVNLLDRLAEPRACLAGVPALIEPGGTLIVATPCTWLPEFTRKENWLGGRVLDGVAIGTRDALGSALSGDFRLVATRDMPFLIPEHARKFQWSIALTTVWRKRAAHEQKETRR